ncbi:MAG: hypothetical protein PVG60_06800 [Desulfarculaceae bacterium]|jgi:hypothetical protein
MEWMWWILVLADALLIVAVLVLLIRLRSLGNLPQIAAAAELQGFLDEASRLAQEFDRLLGEKRELVRTTLTTLDNRITQLQEMQAGLEKPAPARPKSSPTRSAPVETPPREADAMAVFRRQVMNLARQGKTSAQIAQATGRPRGEVELVLGLGEK